MNNPFQMTFPALDTLDLLHPSCLEVPHEQNCTVADHACRTLAFRVIIRLFGLPLPEEDDVASIPCYFSACYVLWDTRVYVGA